MFNLKISVPNVPNLIAKNVAKAAGVVARTATNIPGSVKQGFTEGFTDEHEDVKNTGEVAPQH